ncbi:MAG: hypothetical protein J6B41_04445 [Alistipes sp.]|nr:hypothetical protein [Alistipes sp.]
MNRILYLILCLSVSCSFVACSEGDKEEVFYPNQNQPGNGNWGSEEEDTLAEDVYKYVSVENVYYEDYAIHFTIKSDLHKYYPNSDIEFYFIYEQQYGDWTEFWLLIEPDGWDEKPLVAYSIDSSGRKQYIASAGVCDPSDDETYSVFELYRHTYLVIKDMLSNGETLSDSEEDLYREVVKFLEEQQEEVVNSYGAYYKFRISVKVDGQEFPFKRISFN